MDLQEVHTRQFDTEQGVHRLWRLEIEECIGRRGHDAAQGRVLDVRSVHAEEFPVDECVHRMQIGQTGACHIWPADELSAVHIDASQ